MVTLGIDTSAGSSVAVVGGDGLVLGSAQATATRQHAELLAPMIASVLVEAGVDRGEVTDVVVGTGPAPFTGLRVGLVTARTLGFTLGVPVHGVSGLDAIAARAVDLGLVPAGGEVLVATDARRREVYWAAYRAAVDGDVVLLDGPAVARPADLAGRTQGGDAAPAAGPDDGGGRNVVVVGRGVLLYPELSAAGGPDAAAVTEAGLLDPDPAVLVRLAGSRLAAGRTDLGTEPLYLRRPDITRATAPKSVLG